MTNLTDGERPARQTRDRYAVGLAVVLAISAQVAGGGPGSPRWKGPTADRIGPKRGPMALTPTHRNEVVLGRPVATP